jgi:hypothetical protein
MKNVFMVPGWMKSVAYYKRYEGLNIWKCRDKKEKSVDFLVAHSLGCTYALSECKLENIKKIVLVNPLVPKRNVLSWIYRWLKYALSGAVRYDPHNPIVYFPYAVWKFLRIHNTDILKRIDSMGKEKFVVIRGIEDTLFCDEYSAKQIRENGITLIEAENLGHEWDARYDEIVMHSIFG